MQPDDYAFVVARLPLPADCSDSAAVAAAWPPDTLGFGHMHPPAPQQPDLLVPPAAAVQQQGPSTGMQQQGSGGTTLHAWGAPDASSATRAGPRSHQLEPEGLRDSGSMTLASSSAAASSAVLAGPQQQQQQQPLDRQELVSNDSTYMSPTRRGTAVNRDGFVAATAQGDVRRNGQMQGQAQSGSSAQRYVSVCSPGIQGALLFPAL
jgi:hypothetical protein